MHERTLNSTMDLEDADARGRRSEHKCRIACKAEQGREHGKPSLPAIFGQTMRLMNSVGRNVCKLYRKALQILLQVEFDGLRLTD